MVRINTSILKLKEKGIKYLSKLVINWCFDHLGENSKIRKPLIICLDYNKEGDCAEYIIEEKRLNTKEILDNSIIKKK